MTLTAADPHYWAPVPEIVAWLTERLPWDARVLEIGPGHAPFPRADTFVDFVGVRGIEPSRLVTCDVANEPLPFPDKAFDFVYARHVLEDMFNPFQLCREMARVGKAGYVETPSPLAELCRGVDGGAPAWRGYHHHRFLIWPHDGRLTFVSKYPLVEHFAFDELGLAAHLKRGPRWWNTCHLWSGDLSVRHLQSPLDFDIPRDYRRLLETAQAEWEVATVKFWNLLPQQTIKGPKRAFA